MKRQARIELEALEIAAWFTHEPLERIQRSISIHGYGVTRDYVASRGVLPESWEDVTKNLTAGGAVAVPLFLCLPNKEH